MPALAQRRERSIDTWKPLHYDVATLLGDQLILRSPRPARRSALKSWPQILTRSISTLARWQLIPYQFPGQPARFERKPEAPGRPARSQAAKSGDQINIVIKYHGRPKDGLIFANDRDGKPSATGDNWPNRVHQWIPCLDHPSAKATVSFTVAAPPREVVVANGKFVTMTRNGTAPSLWRFEETNRFRPIAW